MDDLLWPYSFLELMNSGTVKLRYRAGFSAVTSSGRGPKRSEFSRLPGLKKRAIDTRAFCVEFDDHPVLYALEFIIGHHLLVVVGTTVHS